MRGSTAQAATHIQTYFHSSKFLGDEALLIANVAPWALVSAVSVVFALALLVFHGRVANNTFRFLGLVAFIALLTAWIYSLALWSFNKLLLLLGVGGRHPFDPPAWNTVISFGALLVFGSLYFALRLRQPPASSTNASTVNE